jgi:HSP20 family molecular chaperone IbpA
MTSNSAKQKWQWFTIGVLGMALGIFVTVLSFVYFPSLQTKFSRPSRASRQMQAWNDFHENQKQMLEHFDRLFQDDFGGEDVFNLSIGGAGASGSLGVGQLSQREDDKFVYFDLEVEDLKSTSIQSKVENGYLTVSGVVEKKNTDENVQHSFKSEFHRTFPLPEGIDTKKMEVISEGHRVTFKFPKV